MQQLPSLSLSLSLSTTTTTTTILLLLQVPVRLARSVWRALLGEEKTMSDLREEDYSQYSVLHELTQLHPNDIESMGLDFTVRLSDNRVKPLLSGNRQLSSMTTVTKHNVHHYLTLAKRKRLTESRTAVQAIVRGFSCVVPLNVIRSMYTWEQLEEEVCGVEELNVGRLKSHTSWPHAELDASVENMFWRCLESFDHKQSANFLRFCWGRTRLPQDPDQIFLMRVKPLLARGSNNCSTDDLLPNAHTCDFSLLLPPYSSYSIMRTKLLRAISEQGFDLDGGATGVRDMNTVAAAMSSGGSGSSGMSGTNNNHHNTGTTTGNHGMMMMQDGSEDSDDDSDSDTEHAG